MNIATPILAAAAQVPSNVFVCLMGMCTVFIGLCCIIVLVELMAAFCNKFLKPSAPAAQKAPAPTPAPVSGAASTEIENRGELVAAICAAAAEELGTDISALRVVSLKKL